MSAGPLSKDASIYVAGHGGLAASAIVRRLKAAGFTSILCVTRQQLDLRDLGWRHQIELGTGIASSYDWFRLEMAAGAHSSQ